MTAKKRKGRRVEDTWDAEGFLIPGFSAWDCERCNQEVCRYRGQRSADCTNCGASYSPSGQLYRNDWRGNPSNYDDNIGDLEGFEIQQLRKEGL